MKEKFKQPWVIFVISILIATLFLKHEQPSATPVAEFKHSAGMVVAYYDNDYQRYAVEKLMERNKIQEWYCLWSLWTKESNWRPKARNKASGALGIGQLLPRTYRNLNIKHSTNGYRQVDAGLLYIDHHWGGSICRAYAHQLARGYY